MLEKTGMLELTAEEVAKAVKSNEVPSRIKEGWNISPEDLGSMIKAGEYRLVTEEKDQHVR